MNRYVERSAAIPAGVTVDSVSREGRLGCLRKVKGRGLRYRCGRKGCQKYTVPHANHPLFSNQHGPTQAPFKKQVAILFSILAGSSNATIRRLISSANHKIIERISFAVKKQREKFVK